MCDATASGIIWADAREAWGIIFAESSRDDAVFEGAAMETMEAYICPRRADWPVYDPALGEFVTCSGQDDDRESMLALSPEEAACRLCLLWRRFLIIICEVRPACNFAVMQYECLMRNVIVEEK